MADNILNLCTTTISEMESVLWPYLLEFIVAPQYTEALAGVCKSIAYVAALKRENDDEDYLVDFEREGFSIVFFTCLKLHRLTILFY